MVFWNLWLYTNFPTMKLKTAWWLSSQSKAARSVISELIPLKCDYSEYRMTSGRLLPMKAPTPEEGGLPTQKANRGSPWLPWDLCWIWEHHQWGKVWVKTMVTVERPLYCTHNLETGTHCRGFSMPVLLTVLYSSLSWASDRKKTQKKGGKSSLCYYRNLTVIFRNRIFSGIINRHEQDLC